MSPFKIVAHIKGLIVGSVALAALASSAVAAPHLVVDLGSGRVLSSQQAFDPWHPASLTKLMTALSVFKAIDDGRLRPDDVVRMSATATRQPPSKMGYGVGTKLTVENALKLLIVKSANDVAVALAETVSGSVAKFAEQMNRDAARLGMSGSRFVNPHGLHDKRQVVTARDMGLLLQAMHRSYPQYAPYFAAPAVLAEKRNKKKKTIRRVYYSYNLLLERFRGADGFKTGFVCASGYNFAGSASRGGRRIAAVVLGRNSQTERAVDAAKLLTEAFQLPVNEGTPIGEIKAGPNTRTAPSNMRSLMCSEAARAKRYEPGAGLAVINSPWLQKRVKQKVTLLAKLGGGRSGVQSVPASRVPLPTFRPRQMVPVPIDGVVAASLQKVPVPAFRPNVAAN